MKTRTAAGDLEHSRNASMAPEHYREDADTLALQSIAASLVRVTELLERQLAPRTTMLDQIESQPIQHHAGVWDVPDIRSLVRETIDELIASGLTPSDVSGTISDRPGQVRPEAGSPESEHPAR